MPDTSNEPKDDKKPDASAAPSPPASVSADEFNALKATMAQQQAALDAKISQLTEAVLSGRQQAPPPEQKQPRKRVTREEVEAAMNDGKGADAVMAIVGDVEASIQERVDASIAKLTKEVIDPIKTTGFSTLESLTKEVVKTKMPEYTRFKDEIDKAIANLPPDARLNPEYHVFAHDIVVGRNMKKIVAEEVEKALRQGAGDDGAGTPGSATGRNADTKGKTPTPEQIWGPEALDALRSKGVSAEAHVQKLGHKDWNAYVEFWNKQHEESNA